MTRQWKVVATSVAFLILTASVWSGGSASLPAQSAIEWNFNRDGDLEGWQPNAQVKDPKVSGGVLSFRSEGSDPILELRPLMDVKASPWQVIEVRLKADRDGVAEFFWSNTTQTQYGGFSPGKQTPFNVVGDNQWRTYRIFRSGIRREKLFGCGLTLTMGRGLRLISFVSWNCRCLPPRSGRILISRKVFMVGSSLMGLAGTRRPYDGRRRA